MESSAFGKSNKRPESPQCVTVKKRIIMSDFEDEDNSEKSDASDYDDEVLNSELPIQNNSSQLQVHAPKNSNDSEDGENSEKSDESDYEDFKPTIQDEDSAIHVHSKKRKIAQGFIEDEAELSGVEESSDEDEAELEDEILENEEYEDIPKNDEVLRNQIGRIHLKHMQDEDDRLLKMVQNDFLDEGEFHANGERKKKFSWTNKDIESEAPGKVNSSDSEEDNVEDFDQREHWNKLKWKNEALVDNLSNHPTEAASPKNGNLKMKIVGKSNVSVSEIKMDVSLKRKRGSLINSEGMQVKRMKETGSITRKQTYFFKKGLS